MDYKSKVDYLSGYKRKSAEISAALTEYERWLTIGARVTQVLDAAPGGGGCGGNRVEKAAIELSGIRGSLEKEIEECIRLREEIRRTINAKAKKPRYAELLRWRYVAGLSNAKIAWNIRKDEKTVSRAMVRAIKTLDI